MFVLQAEEGPSERHLDGSEKRELQHGGRAQYCQTFPRLHRRRSVDPSGLPATAFWCSGQEHVERRVGGDAG